MYCIYVSIDGKNIQRVINDYNQVVTSNTVQELMPLSKDIKNKYTNMNVSIVDMDSGAILVDYQ